jgi:hypothetical protein
VEMECADNKMAGEGFMNLFAYWPRYRSMVLPCHRQGWVVIYCSLTIFQVTRLIISPFLLNHLKCQHHAWDDNLEVVVLTVGLDNSHSFLLTRGLCRF